MDWSWVTFTVMLWRAHEVSWQNQLATLVNVEPWLLPRRFTPESAGIANRNLVTAGRALTERRGRDLCECSHLEATVAHIRHRL
eukprot:647992-Prorocentrum_minimum.AAC.3